MTKNVADHKKWSAIIEFENNQPLYVRFRNAGIKGCIDTTRKLAPIKTQQGKNLNVLSLRDWQGKF